MTKHYYVLIRSDQPIGDVGEEIARNALGTAASYYERFLVSDPVARFRGRIRS